MSGHGGYGYGNDQSYGYDYSQGTGNNYNYGGYNYESTTSNSFASPYAQAQPSMNQQSTHQQAYNPAESLLNNPAAQIGMQFGTQAISAGQEYVNNNVNSFQ